MYMARFADKLLAERLKSAGAVLIEGTKGSGKTETSMQQAASVVRFDADEEVRIKMEVDPKLLLAGKTPRLLDEWQEFPAIWNYVRRSVDERRKKGQFILTGSASPEEQSKRHSGVGRFSVMKMRTMSLYEKNWSTGEVSLLTLMDGKEPSSDSVTLELHEYAEKITLGGWPGTLHSTVAEGRRFVIDYANLIAEADLSKVSNKRRDPIKIKRLLQSLARNISTEATLAAITRDTKGSDGFLDDETVADYLYCLERLMLIDDLPAWNTHIRSSYKLRKMPKRHFADPSIAVGILGLTADKMLEDLNYFGLLFESLAIHNLRTYADVGGGEVFHYRDSSGHEIDAIVEYPDGEWGAFEIKLGFGAAEEAAGNLLKFAAKIDTSKTKAPSALVVITSNGFAHRRRDGVCVVPLCTLTV